MTAAGRVVILNGASSAGKTSIAQAFVNQRAAEGELWLLTGLDDYIAKLPGDFVDVPGWHGPRGAEGMTMTRTDAGVEIHVGPVGARVFDLFRRTAALWAARGCNVLVDEVVLSEQNVHDWHAALAGLDVTWVAVHCDAAVNDAREAARGDRQIGLARVQRGIVHAHVRYDITLDATTATADELAAELAAALDA